MLSGSGGIQAFTKTQGIKYKELILVRINTVQSIFLKNGAGRIFVYSLSNF